MKTPMLSRRSLLGMAAVGGLRARGRETGAPLPFGAVPSQRQLAWGELETYSFLHFTVNTFTGKEWGEGDEDPNIFNPSAFEPDAMAEALRDAGMKGVILTCKHHDGFCLWPTKTTEHCIRNSKWRGGKGDVVRDVAAAARRHGLRFGVYLSPWDRNNGAYGKPEYIEIYRRQLAELLSDYGPIFEVWHDGANGGTGYYGGARERRLIDKAHYYDWPNTWALVRKLQPEAVVFSDVGPDIRWVGNEKGIAGETCWATYDPVGAHGGVAAPGDVDEKQSPVGTRNGRHWMPAECDVSIRPGWFYHAEENGKVRPLANLIDLYFQSVGRGASFLLNVPPDRRGQFDAADQNVLRAFGKWRKEAFATDVAQSAKTRASNVRGNNEQFSPARLVDGNRRTYWTTEDGMRNPEVTLEWAQPVSFNIVRLREAIELGQRIGAVSVEAESNGAFQPIASATSIGNCRLLRLDKTVRAKQVRVRITDAAAAPALSELALFHDPASR